MLLLLLLLLMLIPLRGDDVGDFNGDEILCYKIYNL